MCLKFLSEYELSFAVALVPSAAYIPSLRRRNRESFVANTSTCPWNVEFAATWRSYVTTHCIKNYSSSQLTVRSIQSCLRTIIEYDIVSLFHSEIYSLFPKSSDSFFWL